MDGQITVADDFDRMGNKPSTADKKRPAVGQFAVIAMLF